jgi:hypothetical protein
MASPLQFSGVLQGWLLQPMMLLPVFSGVLVGAELEVVEEEVCLVEVVSVEVEDVLWLALEMVTGAALLLDAVLISTDEVETAELVAETVRASCVGTWDRRDGTLGLVLPIRSSDDDLKTLTPLPVVGRHRRINARTPKSALVGCHGR